MADELPDSFIAAIRKACKTEQKDALLLGEVWEDASHKISYDRLREYLLGQELDCTMHYPFRDGAVAFLMGQKTAGDFAEEMESIRENYPETALYGALNLVGTHDTPRILTVLGESPEGLSEAERENYRLPPDKRDMALRRLRLLDELLFAFPGVPCVYYGDEAGVEGYADPFNRGTFPWGREDGDLQYHVRMLSNLRKEYPVLTHGTARYAAVNDAVFLLERRWKDSQIILYVNRSWTEQTVEREDDGLSWLDLLTGTAHTGKTLTIAPCTAVMRYREGTQKTYSPLPELVKKPKGKGILCRCFLCPGEPWDREPMISWTRFIRRGIKTGCCCPCARWGMGIRLTPAVEFLRGTLGISTRMEPWTWPDMRIFAGTMHFGWRTMCSLRCCAG